jgi:hypothetical protein
MQLGQADLLPGRQLGRQPVEVERDQLVKYRPRRRAEPARGHAQRLDPVRCPRQQAAADVIGSGAANDGLGSERGRQGIEQGPGQVFFRRERARQRASGIADAGRVRAEEHRRRRYVVPVDRHGDREMMSLEPPPPGVIGRGIAEDINPVVPAVPPELPAFLAVEHLLQGDDGHGLRVGMPAEPGSEQPVRGLAGGDGKPGQAGAWALAVPVFQPAPGSIVFERPYRQGPLLVVKLGEQASRR